MEKNEAQEEIETLNFEKPDFSFTPKGNHMWKQQGYYIVCKGCDLEHAVWVGRDHIMTGIQEDGQPVLKSRKEIGMS